MSVSHIFGNVTIVEGERVSSGYGNNTRSSHIIYKTSIYTEDDTPIPALIWTYARSNAPILEDDTVVFIFGKIGTTVNGPYNIEVINMFPYPGEPSDPMHGNIPPFTPRLLVLGHISGSVETTEEGNRLFKINSSAYIRDAVQATSFMAYFNTTPRWKNTPKPMSNSAIHVVGPINHVDENNLLAVIQIEDVTFQAGSKQGGSSISDGSKGSGAGAAGGRRFPVAGWNNAKGNKKPAKRVERSNESYVNTHTPTLYDPSENISEPHSGESSRLPSAVQGRSTGPGNRPSHTVSDQSVSATVGNLVQQSDHVFDVQDIGRRSGILNEGESAVDAPTEISESVPKETTSPNIGYVMVNGRPSTPHPYPVQARPTSDKEHDAPHQGVHSLPEAGHPFPTGGELGASNLKRSYLEASQGNGDVCKSKRVRVKAQDKETPVIPTLQIQEVSSRMSRAADGQGIESVNA